MKNYDKSRKFYTKVVLDSTAISFSMPEGQMRTEGEMTKPGDFLTWEPQFGEMQTKDVKMKSLRGS